MLPLIILQKTLFEIMIFLLVIADFGSVQPKTLLNQHRINSKQFSVFRYFSLLNCYVINSGWSLWIVSPAMQNFAKFCFSLLFIIFIHCIIHLLTDIYYLFTDNGHFVVLNEKITFFVFNLVLNYQLFFDLINPNSV